MREEERAAVRRPVQVLLDAGQFIAVFQQQPPKGKKDFYAGNDAGFARHRAHICAQLRGVALSMRRHGDPLGFIKVGMREDALGKSYRPLGTLFRNAHGFAFVGTDRVGELLFQATPHRLEQLARILEFRAEDTPRLVENPKTGAIEARPSAYRAECSAIQDIELYDAADRVSFSAADAVQWLSQDGVIGGYVIELFRARPNVASEEVAAAVASLRRALHQLPSGIRVRDFSAASLDERAIAVSGSPMITMALDLLEDSNVKDIRHALLGDGEPIRGQPRVERLPLFGGRPAPSLDRSHHAALLAALAEQSLVRNVELAPVIECAPSMAGEISASIRVHPPKAGASYPVVGIIDGGVAAMPELDRWCIGRARLTAEDHKDHRHGTFIAGLVAAGAQLNEHIAPQLEGGCKFFDIDIFPRRERRREYFGSDIDYFFDVLDESIRTARRDHRTRVFNLSFGVRSAGARTGYSAVADRLDRLARELDVILVVSAGNLPVGMGRPPWQKDPVTTVAMLAGYGGDQQITAPGEQLLGLTVAALNPPGVNGHEPGLPTTYSRRGPGVGGARKPDLAHFGGAEASSATGGRTGLKSLTPSGACEEGCGTSYAAPSVAATLATIDHALDQSATREMLLALPIHRATRHDALSHKMLRHVSREFVGFGLTPRAEQALADDPSSITLAFSERLMPQRRLEFDFVWPSSLVNSDGSCRGEVNITLAFTPPIDGDHKAEAMRVELGAHLYQYDFDPITGDESWESQLTQDGSGAPQGLPKTERYLLMAGLKWSPIKKYHARMKQGRGKSPAWRLVVQSLSRAGVSPPIDGVPFTLLMTISDMKSTAPVHDEVRSNLINQGLKLADISVAHKVRIS